MYNRKLIRRGWHAGSCCVGVILTICEESIAIDDVGRSFKTIALTKKQSFILHTAWSSAICVPRSVCRAEYPKTVLKACPFERRSLKLTHKDADSYWTINFAKVVWLRRISKMCPAMNSWTQNAPTHRTLSTINAMEMMMMMVSTTAGVHFRTDSLVILASTCSLFGSRFESRHGKSGYFLWIFLVYIAADQKYANIMEILLELIWECHLESSRSQASSALCSRCWPHLNTKSNLI